MREITNQRTIGIQVVVAVCYSSGELDIIIFPQENIIKEVIGETDSYIVQQQRSPTTL